MTKARRHTLLAIPLLVIWATLAHSAVAASAEIPVAGLAPSQRPAGAPRISEAPTNDVPGSPAWHGVTQPIQPSLKFLHDQGNWYTPFDQPGMPGYYDIRGWHSNPPAARKN